MNNIVEWLESAAGEEWSRYFHMGQNDGGVATRHSSGSFATIKDDHEMCTWNPHRDEYVACGPGYNNFTYTDQLIKADIDKYGMNGVPPSTATTATTVGTFGSRLWTPANSNTSGTSGGTPTTGLQDMNGM